MAHIIRFPASPDRDPARIWDLEEANQAGDSPRAEQALRTALLSAQGADMALGPLPEIGRLFSAARQRLRRLRAPAGATAAASE